MVIGAGWRQGRGKIEDGAVIVNEGCDGEVGHGSIGWCICCEVRLKMEVEAV